MASRPKKTAISTPTPQNATELQSFVHALGVERRAVAGIETLLSADLARLKRDAEAQAAPRLARAAELEKGIEIYCTARRAELTDSGKRQSFETGAGKVEWRKRPPSVQMQRGMVENVVSWLREKGWNDFLRVSASLNKEVVLDSFAQRDPRIAEIPGITVGSTGEDFVVTPLEAEIEGAAS